MKTLRRLISGLDYEVICGSLTGDITSLIYDSRKAERGCAFVCLRGANSDGHAYAGEVVASGARVLVIEDPMLLPEADDKSGRKENEGILGDLLKEDKKESFLGSLLKDEEPSEEELRIQALRKVYDEHLTAELGSATDDLPPEMGLTIIKVPDTREALAVMSAAYFDHPADRLKIVGITGTKGKTTTTYMIREALAAAGHRVGLVGTIEAIIGDRRIPAKNTTPESYELQEDFAKMLDEECDICVMEVSSQGLMMHRVDGFTFEVGIFTNIEPDHIGPNEHKDFEDYLNCKAMLFKKCRYGIFNADADHLEEILAGATCEKAFYGIKESTKEANAGAGAIETSDIGDSRASSIETEERRIDYLASDINLWQDGGHLGVQYHLAGKLDADIRIEVPGRFSVYNSLAAVAVCDHFKVPVDVMKQALLNAKTKGRIEMIHVSDEFSLMIDYAHNAMALESLLTSLREYDPGRLVTLFGCGGNRDRNRRFEMGEVSGRLSDFTIITSDNPRFEDPEAIIDDIETGIKPTGGEYIRITDRKEAIRYAITNGRPGDIVILAGKGHEDYQEIKGEKHHMDERELIAEVLQEEGMYMM